MTAIFGPEYFAHMDANQVMETAQAMSPMHPEQWKVMGARLLELGVTYEQMVERGKQT